MKKLMFITLLVILCTSYGRQGYSQQSASSPDSTTNAELVPLDPDSLNSSEDFLDRWRRKPKPPIDPGYEEPIEERPIVDVPEKGPRFPLLRGIIDFILNRPIFQEISQLIASIMTPLIIFGIWFIPVYVLRWRFVWPVDILTSISSKLAELSKNTKKPFED